MNFLNFNHDDDISED